MIIGTMVRCLKELRVSYGGRKDDDVVPAHSIGIVNYMPRVEDPHAAFELGVSWFVPNRPGGRWAIGIEVDAGDVEVLPPPGTCSALQSLLTYSWEDAHFKYSDLTDRERTLVTKGEHAALSLWIGAPKTTKRYVLTDQNEKIHGSWDNSDTAHEAGWDIAQRLGQRLVLEDTETGEVTTVDGEPQEVG